jgi:hypothetical protein
MNCAEFQRVLAEMMDGGGNAEQESHLGSCSSCSGLVSDLNAISSQARTLQASEEPSPRVWQSIERTLQQWQLDLDSIAEQARTLQASEEPSPRVWNSLEIALRQEGLIRQPQLERSVVPFFQRWRMAWLVPVTAALLVGGVILTERGDQGGTRIADQQQMPPSQGAPSQNTSANDDQQVLEAVASRTPAAKDAYAANLQNVNAYIKDAEQSVQADPNDEEAQQYLMSAYEQKSMIYDMALDRSLP